MRGLIEFFVAKKHWFVFILLEALSLCLLFRSHDYHGSAFFTTANGLVGFVTDIVSSVDAYFGMPTRNHRLEAENEILRAEVIALQQELGAKKRSARQKPFRALGAEVIKSTLHKATNLMTINKGAKDGVKEEMGVVCSSGVVGVVSLTSEHYAIVIPLINTKSMVSCRVVGSEYFGTMQWQRGNTEETIVQGVPRHAEVSVGDRIETNGYSDIFPSGIPIGEVIKVDDSSDGLAYVLTVRLSTDFSNLRDVSVITNYRHMERQVLEHKADSLMNY